MLVNISTSMKFSMLQTNKTDFFLIIKHFNLVSNCWRSITRHRTYRSRQATNSHGTFVFFITRDIVASRLSHFQVEVACQVYVLAGKGAVAMGYGQIVLVIWLVMAR